MRLIKKNYKNYFILITLMAAVKVYGLPQACDFEGTASYFGSPVGGGDNIQAYDAGGQLCGTAHTVSGGYYYMTVTGDDPATSGIDEGAGAGDALTFRINGVTANLSGDNTFVNFGSKTCNLDVPDDHHDITINTNPSGLTFSVDGTQYTAPQTFRWQEGTTKNITVTSPQDDGAGTRNTFSNWSNGQSQNFTYSVPYNDDSFTANFTTQYQLTIVSAYGSPTGAGWYDAGTGVTFGVTSPIESGGTRSVFLSWAGTGSGSYSGPLTSYTVTMNNPITETATWNNEYYLYVNSDHGSVSGAGWYTQGATASFSVSPTTVDEGDTRHFFQTWSSGDAGGYNGTNASSSVTMNNSITETVVWNTEYYLTISENPDEGGDVSPPPPGNWYSSGTNVQLTATPNVAQEYVFAGWTGDASGTENPKNITMDGPKSITGNFGNEVAVTIRTNPSGLSFWADGQRYVGDQTFYWTKNSSHSLDAEFAQESEEEGVRYSFKNWSHGASKQHLYLVSGDAELTANFNTQYQLEIESEYGEPEGAGWYSPGASVSISVSSTVDGGEGIRHIFEQWNGEGSGSYTGSELSQTVTLNNPITETIDWTTQYFLATSENPSDGGDVTPAPPGDWYDAGTTADISADVIPGYLWGGWSGDLASMNNPTQIFINGPKSVEATFTFNMSVKVTTDPPDLAFIVDGSTYNSMQAWEWDAGSSHNLSVQEIQTAGDGTRYIFQSWSDGGAATHDHIVVDENTTITAVFETQYYLEIISPNGETFGEDWYTAGSEVTFGVNNTIDQISDNERFQFDGWVSASEDGYSGNLESPTITLKSPVTETANWKQEFFVSLEADPAWGGTFSPIDIPGDWSSGELTLYALGNTDSSYGFSSWTGDITSAQNPLVLDVDSPKSLVAHFAKGRVIINSSPPGLSIHVDDIPQTTPFVTDWLPGSMHTIGASTQQGDSLSTLYKFLNWSDSGDPEHVITATTQAITYTANYDVYHYLTVQSDSGNATGQGLYKQGSKVSVTIDSLTQENQNARLRFKSWNGTGDGSYTGTMANIQVTMNNPVVQLAEWEQQYKLIVKKFPPSAPGASISTVPSGPWYDEDQSVTMTLTITDPTYDFLGWSGDFTGDENPSDVVMDSSKSIVANLDVPNEPPQIKTIPDTVLFEDHAIDLSIVWLQDFISDDHDPIDSLSFQISNAEHFTVDVNWDQGKITIRPESNWNGTENVTIHVTDTYLASDSASFNVTVFPFPDPPAPFDLVSPSADSVFWTWDIPIAFVWEESANHDSSQNDTITYTFYLSQNEEFPPSETTKIFTNTYTSILVPPQDIGKYFWKVQAIDKQNTTQWCNDVFRFGVLENSVAKWDPNHIPETFCLHANYPNPFNPETRIKFDLPQSEPVQVLIYDIRGALVEKLVDSQMEAGSYEVVWLGENRHGVPVASGIYFAYIIAGDNVAYQKMILLK